MHYTCGHEQIRDEQCDYVGDGPLPYMLACKNYEYRRLYPDRQCGTGGFYCKHLPTDGPYLDGLYEDLQRANNYVEATNAKLKWLNEKLAEFKKVAERLNLPEEQQKRHRAWPILHGKFAEVLKDQSEALKARNKLNATIDEAQQWLHYRNLLQEQNYFPLRSTFVPSSCKAPLELQAQLPEDAAHGSQQNALNFVPVAYGVDHNPLGFVPIASGTQDDPVNSAPAAQPIDHDGSIQGVRHPEQPHPSSEGETIRVAHVQPPSQIDVGDARQESEVEALATAPHNGDQTVQHRAKGGKQPRTVFPPSVRLDPPQSQSRKQKNPSPAISIDTDEAAPRRSTRVRGKKMNYAESEGSASPGTSPVKGSDPSYPVELSASPESDNAVTQPRQGSQQTLRQADSASTSRGSNGSLSNMIETFAMRQKRAETSGEAARTIPRPETSLTAPGNAGDQSEMPSIERDYSIEKQSKSRGKLQKKPSSAKRTVPFPTPEAVYAAARVADDLRPITELEARVVAANRAAAAGEAFDPGHLTTLERKLLPTIRASAANKAAVQARLKATESRTQDTESRVQDTESGSQDKNPSKNQLRRTKSAPNVANRKSTGPPKRLGSALERPSPVDVVSGQQLRPDAQSAGSTYGETQGYPRPARPFVFNAHLQPTQNDSQNNSSSPLLPAPQFPVALSGQAKKKMKRKRSALDEQLTREAVGGGGFAGRRVVSDGTGLRNSDGEYSSFSSGVGAAAAGDMRGSSMADSTAAGTVYGMTGGIGGSMADNRAMGTVYDLTADTAGGMANTMAQGTVYGTTGGMGGSMADSTAPGTAYGMTADMAPGINNTMMQGTAAGSAPGFGTPSYDSMAQSMNASFEMWAGPQTNPLYAATEPVKRALPASSPAPSTKRVRLSLPGEGTTMMQPNYDDATPFAPTLQPNPMSESSPWCYPIVWRSVDKFSSIPITCVQRRCHFQRCARHAKYDRFSRV